ncbi:DUF349 domain-containing protein [Amphritea sp. HPY]|uniref:DUF349 domain-containing protein n=1 Tax=Amphritea sp. HPY TaxID=3421652 RepID=UPI003D7DD290
MFAKFFKPKWQHTNADVRIRAIHRMNSNSEDHQQILSQLVLRDQNPSVRKAAVEKIAQPELLYKVHNEDNDLQIRRSAADRICKIILDCPDSSTEQRLISLQQLDDDNILTHIVLHSSLHKIQLAALTKIIDQHCLCTISINAATSPVRQAAAEQLQLPELLEQVAKAIRNKDKTVFRIIRNKQQKIQQEQQQEAKLRQRRAELLASLRHLSATEYFPQYPAKLDALHTEWLKNEVSETEALELEFKTLTQQCQQLIEEQQRATAAIERLHQQQQDRLLQQQQLLEQMAVLNKSLESTLLSADFSLQDLEQQHVAWQQLLQQHEAVTDNLPDALLKHYKAEQKTASTYHKAGNSYLAQWAHFNGLITEITSEASSEPSAKQLSQQIEQITQTCDQINWPKHLAYPALMQQLQQHKLKIKQQLQQLTQITQHHNLELSELLNTLAQKVDLGETKAAIRLEQKIATILGNLNGSTPKQLRQQHKTLHARLTELKDWQGYAVTPKKEQVCVEMESLIGCVLPVAELAKKINQLQLSWKELDASDPFHSRTLWQRFKSASDHAYLPCEQHFADQKLQRQKNLEQRHQLAEQLQQFISMTDWDAPDWQQVELICRTAKQEWKQYAPVDRTPGKEVQSRFNALLKQLDSQIKSYRERNAGLKQALVDQAREIAENETLPDASQQIKQLQQEWKTIGSTFHSAERKLWPEFRQYCKAVFENRNKQKQSEQHNKHQQQVDELQQQQLAELNNLIKSDLYLALQRRVSLCEHLERMILADGLEQDKVDSIISAWDQGDQPAEPFAELIEQRFNATLMVISGQEPIDSLLSQSEQSMRQLCIRLEIMQGQPSPEQDQALRMEYQMHRLQQALQQRDSDPTLCDLKQLKMEWNCIPFTQLLEELNLRFSSSLPFENDQL